MDDKEDLNAVRINIPLSRVNSVEKLHIVSFAGLVAVTFDPKSSNGASQQPTSDTDDKEVMTLLETAPEKQVLQFGIMRENIGWVDVMSYVDKARTSASSDNVDWPGSRVYIDVDPRINESSETSNNNLSNLVKSVSFSLGLDASKEIWSTFRRFFSSRSHLMFISFSSQSPSSSSRRELFRSHCCKRRMCRILVEIRYWSGHSLPYPSVPHQCREAV
jgi:hypothetical protein